MIQEGKLFPDNKRKTKEVSLIIRDLVFNGKNLKSTITSILVPFTSEMTPMISIEDYVERLIKYTTIEGSTLISLLIYMDRFYETCDTDLSEYNFHRVFLTAMVIAIKYNEDIHYKNDILCKIGGVTLVQLNEMESILLKTLDFHLFIRDEEYKRYLSFFNTLIISNEN